MASNYIDEARRFSEEKLNALRDSLTDAHTIIVGKACVYVTGSFGRLEAGSRSDLDLFIVSDIGASKKGGEETKVRLLSGIDEIKLQYHLIQSVEKNALPEFDGDGKYLGCHTFNDFTKNLGGPQDDASNTLTGRLLLLLESKPLLGEDVYDRLVTHVVERYFRDYADNPKSFLPAFLFNDILRMWRTFCVNYEHNRKVGSVETKIKNLKLKYSRMLTCYSGLLFLLNVHRLNGTVCQKDVTQMISMTPIERLQTVRDGGDGLSPASAENLTQALDRSISGYCEFLQFTHQKKEAVISEYERNSHKWRGKSYEFGKSMEQSMSAVGRKDGESSALYRLMLI